MRLGHASRKALFAVHVASSLGWLGALLVFAAHAAVSVAGTRGEVVRAACLAMDVAAWYVILPLALLALVSGVAQALSGPWGLVRHYWTAFKLLFTAVATAVLLLKLGPIGDLAVDAARVTGQVPLQARVSLLVHAVAGAILLVLVTVLAVYKPAGRISFRRGASDDGLRGAPAWAVGLGLLTLALGLMIVLMTLHGGHGPWVHSRG